jgi:uncharacterized protein DUF6263
MVNSSNPPHVANQRRVLRTPYSVLSTLVQRRIAAHALIVIFCYCTLAFSSKSEAQTLLRWKLKPGDAFTVDIHQETDSQVGFSGKQAKTKITLDLKLGWKVTAAGSDDFTIRQTVDSIRETLDTPDMGSIQYDSSSSARPSGQARELAESIKPLVGAEFELKMTPRGEIASATPANDSAKALVASGGKSNAEAAAQDGLQQMLKRSLALLPEQEVKAGDTWTATSDRATAAGPLKLETTYRLENLEGNSLAKIAMTAKAQSSPTSKTTIKQHQHEGTLRFSVADGRLVSIEQKQKLVTERPYRETTITVTLESTQTTTLQ